MFTRSAVPPETVAFGALVATAIGTVLGPVNLILIGLWVLAVICDQLAGMIKAYLLAPKGTPWFDGDIAFRGFLRKGLIALGLVIAGSIDVALLHLGTMGEAVGELTPITKGALAYALIAVWGSVLRNVAIVKEARGMAEFIFRRMDAAKLGHEPPVRRESYDPAAVRVEEQLETTDGRSFRDAALERDQGGDDAEAQ